MNFRSLDLNLLRVFDAVMAERSLARAAGTLSITPSAVSHALKRLKEHVGEDLLIRSGNGIVPTARAEALWPVVQDALAGLRQAMEPGAFDPQVDPASFRLAMADATAALLMPPLVESIESMRALANLRVVPLTTRDPRRLLEQGEVDLAVGHFPELVGAMVTRGDDAPWRRERLYTSEYVCVMRRGHPLAAEPLTLDRFCAAHHLLVSFSGRRQGVVDEALVALGRERRVVLTVNQFFTAGRVVTQSDLLTVLPASFVAATGYRDELVTRALPLAIAPVQVDMLWHRRREADPAHRWLRDQVAAAARRAPPVLSSPPVPTRGAAEALAVPDGGRSNEA